MQYLAVIVKASLRWLATILWTAAALSLAMPLSLAQDTPIHPTALASPLHWHAGPSIPDALGLAGPIVGVHNNILIAGGGANFAQPVWESSKRWHNRLFALDLQQTSLEWRELSPMPAAWGYSACISTPQGIVVIGGNDAEKTINQCWLIRMQRRTDGEKREITAHFARLPDLPQTLAHAQVAYVHDSLLVCTGQTGNELATATAALWKLSWHFQDAEVSSTELNREDWKWRAGSDHPGGPRSFAQATRLARADESLSVSGSSKQTHHDQLLVIGGRRQDTDTVRFLNDTWIYDPRSDQWTRKSDAPLAMTAGTASAIGTNQIAVISGDDGRLFSQTDQLRDDHPGFARRGWIYDANRDRWTGSFTTPANQVTTTAVSVGSDLWLISGEIRPRVRTPNVWKISVVQLK